MNKKLSISILIAGIVILILAGVIIATLFVKTPDGNSLHTHSYAEEYTIDINPTCVEKGEQSRHCTVEGCTERTDLMPIDVLGHDFYTDGTITVEPTCTEKGEMVVKCKNCDETKVQEVMPLGHSYGAGTVTQVATCIDDEITQFTCTRCEDVKQEIKKAQGHKLNAITFTATNIEGKTVAYKTCKVCGENVYLDDSGNPIEDSNVTGNNKDKAAKCKAGIHEFGEPVITQPTCSEAGTKVYTCTLCNETKTETIDKTAHNFELKSEESTCEEQGYVAQVCTICGYEDERIYKEKIGHSFDDGKVTKAPTCSTEGIKTFTCKNCDSTKEEMIPATGQHTFQTVVETDELGEYIKEYCTVCGYTNSIIRSVTSE